MSMDKHSGNEVLATYRSRHGIVGSLPFELVLHIVKYLDGPDIVRCQGVCSLIAHLLKFNVSFLDF